MVWAVLSDRWRRLEAWLWVAGAAAVLSIFLLRGEISLLRWTVASSPVIAGTAEAPRWRLVAKAGHLIPSHSTFTVRAPDAASEMRLFTMAQAALQRRNALPGSYAGKWRGEGAAAQYVIVDGTTPFHERGARLIARFKEGAVYRRGR